MLVRCSLAHSLAPPLVLTLELIAGDFFLLPPSQLFRFFLFILLQIDTLHHIRFILKRRQTCTVHVFACDRLHQKKVEEQKNRENEENRWYECTICWKIRGNLFYVRCTVLNEDRFEMFTICANGTIRFFWIFMASHTTHIRLLFWGAIQKCMFRIRFFLFCTKKNLHINKWRRNIIVSFEREREKKRQNSFFSTHVNVTYTEMRANNVIFSLLIFCIYLYVLRLHMAKLQIDCSN